MSRMDVKKRMELMSVYESYWYMSPSKMQDYIFMFKIVQEYNDEARKEVMSKLHEILFYA